jgi:hypothetical protein
MKITWLNRILFVIFSLSLFDSGASAQFTISASPAAISVVPGNTTTTLITVNPVGGFAGSVALTITGSLPTGVTAAFVPTTLTSSQYTSGSTLTITASGSASGGSPNSIAVTGTNINGGTTVNSNAAVALTVQPSTNQTSQGLLGNLGFGLALGLSTNVTGPNIVNNATVDANGIVRVNTRANTSAGFMFETHYYIWTGKKYPIATGPFVAAQPGSSQIISAVGAGWMLGFRRPQGSATPGFGLGLGYEAIPAAQVLGSEFVDGQKAPVDPSGNPIPIRYETQDKGALLAIFSVTF